MSTAETMGLKDAGPRLERIGAPHARAVGSPLPVGDGGRAPLPLAPVEALRPRSAPAPERALATTPAPAHAADSPTGLQRAMHAVRSALPYVQRILPLLDGNIASAVSNILAPVPHPAPPPAPPVDLEPLQNGLTDLRTQHRELRGQIQDQNASLKRVEDQLEMVREATDRNTLEQQELIEDLKAVGNKVNVFAVIALVMLAASLLLNVFLYLRLQHALP